MGFCVDAIFRRAGLALLASLGFFLTAAPALSQPSQSQVNAIRQNCRSDYMAHCSSVPPGGAESLNCLQNNLSRLSGLCRSAVDALKPAAAAPAPKPAAAPPPAPAATPAPERATAPARAPATAAAPQERPAPAPKPAKRRHRAPRQPRPRRPPRLRPSLRGSMCRCRRCCRVSNWRSSAPAMATGRQCAAWCRLAVAV